MKLLSISLFIFVSQLAIADAKACIDLLHSLNQRLRGSPNPSYRRGFCVKNIADVANHLKNEPTAFRQAQVLFLSHEERKHSGIGIAQPVDLMPEKIMGEGVRSLGHHAIILLNGYILDPDLEGAPRSLSDYFQEVFPQYHGTDPWGYSAPNRLQTLKVRLIPVATFLQLYEVHQSPRDLAVALGRSASRTDFEFVSIAELMSKEEK